MLTFLMLLVPLALYAQRETIPALAVITSPGFFTALVAGIILAIGFQLILTNLSAAIGLSALHMGTERIEKYLKYGREHGKSEGSSEPVERKVRKVNAAFGIWAIVTTSISLFFAAWLAVKISTALNLIAGVTLGLAIWGLFYVVTAILEMTALTSIVGSLMDLVRSGFRTFSETTTSVFRKSSERRAADTAREITDAVRDEIFGDANVRNTIQRYIDSLKPDYNQIRKELTAVLNDAEIDVKTTYAQGSTTAHIHTGGTSAPSAGEAKGKAQEAAAAVKEEAKKVSEEARSDKDLVEKIADTTMEMAGLSRQEAEQYRHKIEEYLAATGKKELNPDGIKRDIDKLVSDPKAGVDAILARLNDIDRSTITSILAQRKDMNRDEANRVVDMVAGTVNNLKSQYQKTKESTRTASSERQGGIETKIRNYLDSLDNPELHYTGIKSDFETLIQNPRAGAGSLFNKLKSMDRHDLKQMVAHSRVNMSEQDIDQIVDKIEEARESVIGQAENMRQEVTARVQRAEEEAVQYADDARKVAASAAWWVFGSALVSGVAAALGGLVGLMV